MHSNVFCRSYMSNKIGAERRRMMQEWADYLDGLKARA